MGWFREKIDRDAFSECDVTDVIMCFNHNIDSILARTTSGTLSLSTDDEADEFYFLFSLNGLLRGDAKTRSEFYKNMNLVGAMSANEIRALEDMNSYDGGDTYFVQANMQSIDKALTTQYEQVTE